MSAKETGGAAFPTGTDVFDNDRCRGMTLRDYFAAAAMQGYIAAGVPSDSTYDDLAEKAFKAADSMLEERKR